MCERDSLTRSGTHKCLWWFIVYAVGVCDVGVYVVDVCDVGVCACWRLCVDVNAHSLV